MSSRRMSGPAPNLRVAMLVLVLAAPAESRSGATKDLRKNCPSACECDMSASMHIVCRELFSLPGSIPKEARSFRCMDCPIARMTGNAFQNYTAITQLSLAGSSRPDFDEQSLEFLRSVQILELEGYELTPVNLLSLVGSGNTLVLRNISLVVPPRRHSLSAVPATDEGDYPSARTTGGATITEETEHNSHTTLGTSVGGYDLPSSVLSVHGGAPSTPTPQVHTNVPKVEGEESFLSLWVMGMSFTLLVVLTAVLAATTVWTYRLEKEVRHVGQSYTQVQLPTTLVGRLKTSSERQLKVLRRSGSIVNDGEKDSAPLFDERQ